jgi:hypothetical protein
VRLKRALASLRYFTRCQTAGSRRRPGKRRARPSAFKLQRVANVPEHPPPSTRLMSCAHIANRQLSRIIGASTLTAHRLKVTTMLNADALNADEMLAVPSARAYSPAASHRDGRHRRQVAAQSADSDLRCWGGQSCPRAARPPHGRRRDRRGLTAQNKAAKPLQRCPARRSIMGTAAMCVESAVGASTHEPWAYAFAEISSYD